jgi:ribosomal protein L34
MRLHVRNTKRKQRRQGFRARMKTADGRKIVNARRALRGTFP